MLVAVSWIASSISGTSGGASEYVAADGVSDATASSSAASA
jgi:hypothetical protein